jgi:arabinofuranosyltransferase
VMSGPRIDKAFLIVAVVFCIYAGLFIYRTSFVIDGERYFSLFDDAMISMRYAKHLADGDGLVWNVGGERVEGYTNLLWTLYMAVLHLLPVAQSKTSLLVQASSALFLLLNLVVIRKIACAVSGNSRFVWLGAVVVTASYLPLNGWSLQGMEVGVLALVLSLAALAAIGSLKSGGFSARPYVLLLIGMFVRMDMAVPFLAMLVFLAVADRKYRSKHLLYGTSLFAVALIGQTIFRLVYYGEILPNTYYLKLAGYPFFLRIVRGLYVTSVFIWRLNWVLFLVPFVLLVGRRMKETTLLMIFFVAQIAYSVYVGGDAWESWGGSNRYVSIAMPCFFVAYFSGLRKLGLLAERLILAARPETAGRKIDAYARRAWLAALVLSCVSFTATYGPAAVAETLLFKRTLHVDSNEKMVERAVVVSKITNDKASIAVVWDGAIPYFSNLNTVSILGKNDQRIARLKMRTVSGPERFVAFYPGHLKWDYGYSIGQLKPDVVVQLWQNPEEAAEYLERDYMPATIEGFTFNLLRGSPNILWDRVWSLATAG